MMLTDEQRATLCEKLGVEPADVECGLSRSGPSCPIDFNPDVPCPDDCAYKTVIYPTGLALMDAYEKALVSPWPVIFGTECSPKGHLDNDGYNRPAWKAWVRSYYADARRIDVVAYGATKLTAMESALWQAFVEDVR